VATKIKKIHLQKSGTRSYCRFTSRPSRGVVLLSLQDFASVSKELRCTECGSAYEKMCSSINLLAEG